MIDRSSMVAAGSAGPQVVIVGAGLAGLTAAYRLVQAGIGCRLFEARDFVGGRVQSSRGWVGGMVGEHGAEWVDTRHVNLRGIAEELGIHMIDRFDPEDDDVDPPVWIDGAWASPDALAEPLLEVTEELTRIARSIGSFQAPEAGPGAVEFDEMSAADWITNATGRSMRSPLSRFLSHRMAGWYGLDPDRLSAATLMDFLVVRFPGDDVRYSVEGGADLVPRALAAELPTGTITYEAALTSIRRARDGTYEVRFDGVAEPAVADHVIVAIPFSVLRDVDLSSAGLSPIKHRAIDELAMGSNAKLLLQLDRPLENLLRGWSGAVERADQPFCYAWESDATRVGGEQEAALLTVFSGGSSVASWADDAPAHGIPPEGVVDRALSRLDQMLPGSRAAYSGSAWLDVWQSDPWARGSYAAFGPGQMTSFLGRLGDAEGGMHFAGEHTSLYSQGYMDGAVESGDRVAAEVLAANGREPPVQAVIARRRRAQFEPVHP